MRCPTKFRQPQNKINGFRPSPLRLNKVSNLIHKASSTSSTLLSSVKAPPIVGGPVQQQQQQKNHPVIIYMQSPKIIHTQPRDFMALVQKLTGFSRSIDTNCNEVLASSHAKEIVGPKVSVSKNGNVNNLDNIKDKESSHDLNFIEEKSSGKRDGEDGDYDNDNGRGWVVDNMLQNFNSSSNSIFADIPLFTPTSTRFFLSPRSNDKYLTGSVYASPKMGNPISPSVYEFIKDLPD